MGKKEDDASFVALWAWGRERFDSLADMGRKLGYSDNPGQTVNNWKRRGVPADAVIQAQKLGYQSKATALPPSPAAARLQARLDGLPADVRAAFETAMFNVIEALRPSVKRNDDEAAAAMAEAKRRVEGKSAKPTQKRQPARKTHTG
jgi:hypothetical protein